MVREVIAELFLRKLHSGHSKPLLLQCGDYEGKTHEVVVKSHSATHGTVKGQACELIAALFGRDLGLYLPSESFLVEVPDGFATDLSDSALKQHIEGSYGINYGSTLMTGPLFTAAKLPFNLYDKAAEVLVFDTWIKNVDRHYQKPNCKISGNNVLIFDHELAFPEVRGVRIPELWEPNAKQHWRNHPFYSILQGQAPDFSRVVAAFKALPSERFDVYLEFVPDVWMSDWLRMQLQSHFRNLRTNAEKTIDVLTKWLR